ncbi:Rubredoxin-NAD(+) reductase [Zhongshania aliphaticivorans]|uniref:Rubredoxin-NAD(+) reductase n=1 Tax=Zhongshania aliphaticivorans TaxID=1470434 RepID=A0A5S9PNZ4_9GAMM|nr:FAD-dependent oxidoreductase [Zhongshania aliphaticivorans]CAA0105373.1 Rubredoxin-NAD(+) reductase [Zhongshania aliphaticivorans]CAA0105700.1 Rubredoxin-NAD(+) reductase [Zhongshania aliphaticivorans]
MSKWECIVCGWVYDEKIGDPDSGIPAGTRWEDIPDDWLCPDCGVGKEDFEMIEQSEESDLPHHEEPASASDNAAIVVIGTGLAGYGLVRELRKHDKDTPVIIITADDGRAYSKPMLSTGFTKNTDADALAQKDAGGMGEDLNASVWTLTKVTAIDTAAQTITIGDKETQVHYKKLVLALGADVIRPPIQGNALEYVYSVNDLLDYDDFRTAVAKNNVKKVCIIGGGLIGCEFTNDLINGGIETETVDPLGYCLPTLLPEVAGKAVQAGLEAKGAKFHFGPLVTEVNKTNDGLAVSLNNGETINCDLVLSAVGVRPQVKLAQDAGITVNRGIATNRLLETSAPNVYAMGDCAEVAGHVLVYVAPLMAQARALAKTLSGEATEVSYPAMPVTIKTPACPVTVSPPPRDAQGNWEIEQDGLNVVARFVGNDGTLLGFALTGEGTKQKMALQKQLPAIMP